MVRWLSPEFFDEARAQAAACAERPELSATIQFELTGGPEGTKRWYAIVESGRFEAGSTGRAPSPDVSLSTNWDDAVAMQRGELDPNVAFMQGRLKVSGSMGVMTALLPATASAHCQELRRRLAAVTEY